MACAVIPTGYANQPVLVTYQYQPDGWYLVGKQLYFSSVNSFPPKAEKVPLRFISLITIQLNFFTEYQDFSHA
jgi:hypothetical protein